MTQFAAVPRPERITAIVAGLLAQRQKLNVPDPGEDLRNAGLTSLDMVKLVLSLEQEFGMIIPEQAMTPTHFRTITAIDSLIASLARAP